MLDDYPAIDPWLDRELAIGHQARAEMSSTEAIATVAASDYGSDPVTTTLAGLSDVESVVQHVDPS
ncbi:hypothetical protein [Bradyrhizobium sp. Ash2021]|uniref:hypothetical protein n=1 Tax=Bradyrhizobium sp. Ash2021 TaxID=2954771 RepID=UPI0028162D05|nr:hypothetical protein [Bradyrhizobium sp. Ash2021]WMT71301.1 hypothetical protein NL528_24730 [Bradyrhizobium sp. Ash2021]